MRYRIAADPFRRRGRSNVAISKLQVAAVAADLWPIVAARSDEALFWTAHCPGCGRLMEAARARTGRTCWRCERGWRSESGG